MSEITVEISNRQTRIAIDRRQVRKTVLHVLKTAGCPKATVSLAVVDHGAIRQLQKRYFGLSVATDVLSFNLADSTESATAVMTLDCEVIVNADRAWRVATDRGDDPLGELNLYIVHGLLHQLGYDDRAADQARAMHKKEDRILEELGFGRVYSRHKPKGKAYG